jgi:hypothetical protein
MAMVAVFSNIFPEQKFHFYKFASLLTVINNLLFDSLRSTQFLNEVTPTKKIQKRKG